MVNVNQTTVANQAVQSMISRATGAKKQELIARRSELVKMHIFNQKRAKALKILSQKD